MTRARPKLFATILITLAASAVAATPNFSGRWKLNAEKSKLDDPYLGLEEERTVDHKEPELSFDQKDLQDGEEDSNTGKFRTDGTETRNLVDGDPLFTKAHWDGAALVFESRLISDTDTTDYWDRWTLSEDGKTLTIARKQKTGFDEREVVFVFDKI